MKENKKINWFNVVIVAFLTLLVSFTAVIVYNFIGMLIDNQCYQLEPNQFYNHTICEKYWNMED